MKRNIGSISERGDYIIEFKAFIFDQEVHICSPIDRPKHYGFPVTQTK